MRTLFTAALMLSALAACARPTIVVDRPHNVSVPVIQKCASAKPAAVSALRDRVAPAAWDVLSPKQKAETIAAQALRRLNYGDQLGAATSAC